MASVRVREGGVTARLSGLDAAAVQAIVDRMAGAAVRPLVAAAERVATDARAAWYGPGGVERETGKSGDIEAVLTLDLSRESARVSVGSTDDRTSRGKPVPVYVHAPGGASVTLKPCTVAEYWATPAYLRGPFRRPAKWREDDKQPFPRKWTTTQSNVAGNLGFLLNSLVKKPMRAQIKALLPQIGTAIAGQWGARG